MNNQANSTPLAVRRTSHAAPPVISARALTKTFGSVRAVDGIDLDVAPGEIVAFLGPNGAGKSTSIDLILGLSEPTSGQVSVLGGNPHDAVRAGRVGAMLQSGPLLPDLTVRELVDTIAALTPHPIAVGEALEIAGITDIAKSKTQKLSGGQSQRVRFAMAVIPDPELIILDEPTVAMDVEVRRQFWASMHSLTERGRTVMFATHYLEEADDFADRVVVLAHGKVVADATGAQIKQQVSGRLIQARLSGADPVALERTPGVRTARMHDGQIELRCDDSDAALRALLSGHPDLRDIRISDGTLEDAFLQLVGDHDIDHDAGVPALS